MQQRSPQDWASAVARGAYLTPLAMLVSRGCGGTWDLEALEQV